jgi:predicted lipoprotein
MFKRLCALALIAAQSAYADQALVNQALEDHILPGFEQLETQTATLQKVAAQDCVGSSPDLRAAFGMAFDAWVNVSHLRTGPSEEDDRAFALAFWPDTKGFTPKVLRRLSTDRDPAVESPADFATLSIAARGFYALEFLLYDPEFRAGEDDTYACALIRAVASEIHRNAADIQTGWQSYQDTLRTPSLDGPYKTELETTREVFKALHSGLQFTSDARLGRPLGSFDRPRPKRAEARRSERSLRHVELSLRSTYALALILSQNESVIQSNLISAYDRALDLVADLDDPDFSGVSDPSGRFRVEILQQAVDRIREILTYDLAPALGVTAGFNALDGD